VKKFYLIFAIFLSGILLFSNALLIDATSVNLTCQDGRAYFLAGYYNTDQPYTTCYNLCTQLGYNSGASSYIPPTPGPSNIFGPCINTGGAPSCNIYNRYGNLQAITLQGTCVAWQFIASPPISLGTPSYTRCVCTYNDTYTLTVNKGGTGNGTVSNTAGINCGSTCSAPYINGSSVGLTATADPGSFFSSWSSNCDIPNGNQCTVTMNTAKTVTANFAAVTHTLGVSKTGGGTGSITSNPAGINCGITGCLSMSTSFASGTTVILTAAAGPGYTFYGWWGGG
jgi:hypothetical protein